MKTQKELQEKYMNIIKTEIWENDKQMQDFCKKTCAYVVELENGNILTIDKPNIKKDFCFGMGMYNTYTQEEFEAAENLAEKARTDTQYFFENNIKQLIEKIESLQEALQDKKEVYTFINYSFQPTNSDLVAYKTCSIESNPKFSPYLWQNLKAVRKLSSDDIQRIINGYEEVAKKFEKRLNSYLKKYGLSKLNVWTYARN